MMNNRGHLPAGQPIQGGLEMGPGPGGGNGGPRRGGRQHYQGHHPVHQPIYSGNYMAPQYAGAPFYAPPYQSGSMGTPGYMYPPVSGATYNRSPPAMQHYLPMQNMGRPPQHSPVVVPPYQAPIAAQIIAPTSSSVHSNTALTTVQTAEMAMDAQAQAQARPHPEGLQEPVDFIAPADLLPPSVPKAPFRPTLPWLSVPDEPFPRRTPKSRRRRRVPSADAKGVVLPGQNKMGIEEAEELPGKIDSNNTITNLTEIATSETTPKPVKKSTPERQIDTPSSHDDAPSAASATSSTVHHPSQSSATATVASTPKSTKPASRAAVPIVPLVPALPKISLKESSVKESNPESSRKDTSPKNKEAAKVYANSTEQCDPPPVEAQAIASSAPEKTLQSAPISAPAKPKLWTGLFRNSANGVAAAPHNNGNSIANGSTKCGIDTTKPANTLAEALESYRVGSAEKLLFLEPRGLVNTGNMCYMNSVLQVLIFCSPFLDLLNQVEKKAIHKFKSTTPLLDAMIMFMQEFKVIDSATSIDLLRRRLKPKELEQYGEPFTPEFVYEAIRKTEQFASMTRGHQQDAEEFLGFLLEGLHQECAQMGVSKHNHPISTHPSPPKTDGSEGGDDWLEVGPRQKPTVTRNSGFSSTPSPVAKIFGGQLRSEFRVPGLKSSVTYEPYRPLQLDIGSPEVRNIVDALRGLNRPETLHGDFNSPHGKDVKAMKQVFIETLPPILILHLKRFQFDAEGHGTIKIWKKIGYPLELDIPREVLSRGKRNTTLAEGASFPKYRLMAVVYHHGHQASGGHYTVDVRRQDGNEWIRIDDTVIRRVKNEDIAEAGSEESNNSSNQKDGSAVNRFVGMNDKETGDDDGWKQAANGKKWSSVVNGASAGPNGPKTKQAKDIKDNKVAYLLFYQRE